MAAEFEMVDIWVGNFADEEAFQAYMEEQYDEEDEDAPISAFARDLNQSFYDHDLVESKFLAGRKVLKSFARGFRFWVLILRLRRRLMLRWDHRWRMWCCSRLGRRLMSRRRLRERVIG
jgi:Immunity protein 22